MQIERGISRVSVVTFLGAAGRPLPERRVVMGLPRSRNSSEPF